jgi:hypothetical protein
LSVGITVGLRCKIVRIQMIDIMKSKVHEVQQRNGYIYKLANETIPDLE